MEAGHFLLESIGLYWWTQTDIHNNNRFAKSVFPYALKFLFHIAPLNTTIRQMSQTNHRTQIQGIPQLLSLTLFASSYLVKPKS